MIRRFEKYDAEVCSKIMCDCIEKSLNYESKNKKFMILMSSPENIIDKSDKINFFVFELEGKILGTGGLDKNEIKTMFIDIESQNKGIGSQMIIFLEKLAKENGYDNVWCKSSPEAEMFYRKKGLVKIKDDYEYDFHSIFMKKDI